MKRSLFLFFLFSAGSLCSTSQNLNAQAASPLPTIHFSQEEFKAWKIDSNNAKDFSATIVAGDDADQSALRLLYNVQSIDRAHSEMPDSISMSNAALGAGLHFSGDKPVYCLLRVKASQERTVRIFMTDSTGENFFTAQFAVTPDWQTLSIPISQGFWNHWYSTPTSAAVHDQVDWPLQNFRIDLIFAQSAEQFKDADGPSINLPETFLIESISFHQ